VAEPRSTTTRIPVWGIFLLFIGILLLLQTFGVLPWRLWGTLWHFWPVLIIAIGLGILLRHYHFWLVSTLIFILFLACLGIAIWQHGPQPSPAHGEEVHSAFLGDLNKAEIDIVFNAGSLSVDSLPADHDKVLEAVSTGDSSGKDITTNFYRKDSTGYYELSTEHADRRFWKQIAWEVSCAPDIPLTMVINSVVGDLDLDLSELEVTELRMDLDAGNCMITMPSSSGTIHASIKADIVNLEITIPDQVAARIKSETNLAGFDIDESRFFREGDYYLSGDFESAVNRLDLEMDVDIGRLKLR